MSVKRRRSHIVVVKNAVFQLLVGAHVLFVLLVLSRIVVCYTTWPYE